MTSGELRKLTQAQSAEDFEALNIPLLLSIDPARTRPCISTLAVFRAYFALVVPGMERRKLHDLYYFFSMKRRIDMMEPFFEHLTLKELEDADRRRFCGHIWEIIFAGCVDVMTFLLDRGLDVDLRNARNETPLFMACVHRRVDIVDLLLQKGANVNATSNRNVTPVLFAATGGDVAILDRLIMHGADLRVVNGEGIGVWSFLVGNSVPPNNEAFYQRLVDMRVPISNRCVELFRERYPSNDAEKKARILALILSVQEE